MLKLSPSLLLLVVLLQYLRRVGLLYEVLNSFSAPSLWRTPSENSLGCSFWERALVDITGRRGRPILCCQRVYRSSCWVVYHRKKLFGNEGVGVMCLSMKGRFLCLTIIHQTLKGRRSIFLVQKAQKLIPIRMCPKSRFRDFTLMDSNLVISYQTYKSSVLHTVHSKNGFISGTWYLTQIVSLLRGPVITTHSLWCLYFDQQNWSRKKTSWLHPAVISSWIWGRLIAMAAQPSHQF